MSASKQIALRRVHRREKGYVLLVMLLFVALLAITAAAIAPTLAFQLKRDREEELVHRGVQYSRAIRRYYKKFGRYPGRIEDLESSNNLRFLRRRYKDPITAKDFKLLHVGEVKVNFQGGIGGAQSPMVQGANGQMFVNQGLPTGNMGRPGGASGIGLVGTSGGTQANPSQNNASGDDSSDSDSDNSNKGTGRAPGSSDESSQSSQTGFDFSKSGSSNQVFGGGAIVGVASTNTEKTIREYNDKKHYNEWQFIYDPTMDRGGLLTAPGFPKSNMGAGFGQQPGQQQGIGGVMPGQGGAQPAPPGQPAPPPPNQGGNDNDNDNE